MGKKEKEKDKAKKEKEKDKAKKEYKKLLKKLKVADNCKTKCCEKYMKSEDKRCARCPMFDLIEKRLAK